MDCLSAVLPCVRVKSHAAHKTLTHARRQAGRRREAATQTRQKRCRDNCWEKRPASFSLCSITAECIRSFACVYRGGQGSSLSLHGHRHLPPLCVRQYQRHWRREELPWLAIQYTHPTQHNMPQHNTAQHATPHTCEASSVHEHVPHTRRRGVARAHTLDALHVCGVARQTDRQTDGHNNIQRSPLTKPSPINRSAILKSTHTHTHTCPSIRQRPFSLLCFGVRVLLSVLCVCRSTERPMLVARHACVCVGWALSRMSGEIDYIRHNRDDITFVREPTPHIHMHTQPVHDKGSQTRRANGWMEGRQIALAHGAFTQQSAISRQAGRQTGRQADRGMCCTPSKQC